MPEYLFIRKPRLRADRLMLELRARRKRCENASAGEYVRPSSRKRMKEPSSMKPYVVFEFPVSSRSATARAWSASGAVLSYNGRQFARDVQRNSSVTFSIL